MKSKIDQDHNLAKVACMKESGMGLCFLEMVGFGKMTFVVSVDMTKDNFNLSPLHCAAKNGHFKTFRILINSIKEKNPEDSYGHTPLHYAATNGSYKICRTILKIVEEKNPKAPQTGITPLHYAAQEGHYAICKLILENIEEKEPKNNKNMTPLDVAQICGHSAIVKLMKSFRSNDDVIVLD